MSATAAFDPRPRAIEAPVPGCWLVRLVRHGPWCPAMITVLQTSHEPGVPDNDMRGTRSPHLVGLISGQVEAWSKIWETRGRVISRSEYDAALAEMREALRTNTYDPRWNPRKAVKLEALPIPFARKTA